MSKAKKTKQQKIITDLNRKLQAQSQQSSSPHSSTSRPSLYSYTGKTTSHTPTQTMVKVVDLSYVKHDLIKTLIITSSIIAAQVLLFYLLTSHIIMIPMVRY